MKKTNMRKAKILLMLLFMLFCITTLINAIQTYPAWDPAATYVKDDMVEHKGFIWKAKWWTKNEEPGASDLGPWDKVGPVGTPVPTATPTSTPTPSMTPTPEPELVNIAPGKYSAASSQYDSQYGVTNVNDGSYTTVWGSASDSASHWVYIDLAQTANVAGIGLYWYDIYYATAYQVYSSHDAKTWTKILDKTKATAGPDIIKGNMSARYFGIYMTAKNSLAFALTELEIYQEKPPVSPTATPTPSATPTPPAPPSSELSITYETVSETADSFTGTITMKNPNSSYAWNGSFFVFESIEFDTSSTILSVKHPEGGVAFTQTGDRVTVSVGYHRFFEYNKELSVTITGTKAGTVIFPENFSTNYVRGKDIFYPAFQGLPLSWQKGKTTVTEADLIHDPVSYYNQTAAPFEASAIVYNPPSSTQLQIGQPLNVGYPVNGLNDVRMWVPTKYMAMGAAFAYMQLGMNPNWLLAIGTKENWGAAVTKDPFAVGTIIELDGEQYRWPIAFGHPDGPYQVEAGNFNDIVKILPDYFIQSPIAKHGDYMTVSEDLANPNWISSTITCALSLTITRELLHATPKAQYVDFMKKAQDPLAELTVLTFAYNRGTGSLYERQIFSVNRDKALLSTDIGADFDMGGFGSHIPTVKAVVSAMNNELVHIYDELAAWDEIVVFFDELKTFYGNGTPSDGEWLSMMDDVKRAYDILALHWGGTGISVRYDFMTLLKIFYEYHPQPKHPRPTSDYWYFIVNSANP